MTSPAQPPCFQTNPFDHLPSDILVLVYEQLGVRDLSVLGRTSWANRELHETLALPTYLSQTYPLHRQLQLSPALHSTTTSSSAPSPWTPSALTAHLHLATQGIASREFVARPLPLPPSTSKSKRVAALRPLLAVGNTRVVCGGVGGKRASLVVYELGERSGDQGSGEKVVGTGWEVGFGPGIGEREGSPAARAERRVGGVGGDESPPRSGTGGLLSGDLTGLEFFSSPVEDGEKRGQDESELLLTFANGVVQTVRLPSPPSSSTTDASSPPPPAPSKSSNKSRRRHKPTLPPQLTATHPPLVTLIKTYPHPPSPVQSLSISATSPGLFLTTAYSSLLSLYSPHIPTPTTFTLPSTTQTPWSSLLLSSPSSSVPSCLVGTSTSLLFYPSLSHTQSPRSLLAEDNKSATYALHAHPFHPHLLLSAHSHPLASILLHDLRQSVSEVKRYTDKWTEEGWYSVGMSEDGRTVVGGTGGGGRVGVWDVRGWSGREEGGWTGFAPVGENGAEAGRGSKGVGEVGRLVWKGAGRVWGVTPSSPFLLDFSPSSTLSSLYPSLPTSSLPPVPPSGTAVSAFAPRDPTIVSWYDHSGDKVRPGTSLAFT